MPAVNTPSRPQLMANPLENKMPTPLSAMIFPGVANKADPYRCCWIMTNSIGAQMKPDNTPPMKPDPISSISLSFRAVPPVITPAANPVNGNCRPESTIMFVSDMV